ncbi:MAG: histidine--tRNA ligase [Hydrotalea sp.]|nr:histidine--tRNA ligase [Hydrotalea sp.]
MSNIQSVRGTQDFIGKRSAKLATVVARARRIAELYNYQEIITPLIESVQVFTESLGQESDIIHKEMFVFEDRGGDKICLRPENTAGVMRAFVENGLQQQLPCKFFYHGPMFRYERPQRGRYRQFHQFGVEYLHAPQSSAATAMVDAEVITLGHGFLTGLGIGDYRLEINSLGSRESRVAYRAALVDYFNPYKNDLSADSKMRLQQNPLRILDSKDEGDKKLVAGAPHLKNYYDKESAEKFAALQALLTDAKIPFAVNQQLVRGLDYYCHTAFEFVTQQLGAQGTILAGGRYDDLPAMFGARDVRGVGFAAGLERLLELLPDDAVQESPLLFLCPIGDKSLAKVAGVAMQLRNAGLRVEIGLSGDIKKSLSRANKLNAAVAIIFGDDELAKNQFQYKNLQQNTEQSTQENQQATKQETMGLSDIIAKAKKIA